METCNALYSTLEGVTCKLELGHKGEHWSTYRHEGDPEGYVVGELTWKQAEHLTGQPGEKGTK